MHEYKAEKINLKQKIDEIQNEEEVDTTPTRVDSNWIDRINTPKDVELVEVKVILPKIVVDRFKDAKTFLGNKATPSYAYTFSTRLSKYMLHYHKLCSRKESGLLNQFLNLNYVKAAFKEYDSGKITLKEVIERIISNE